MSEHGTKTGRKLIRTIALVLVCFLAAFLIAGCDPFPNGFGAILIEAPETETAESSMSSDAEEKESSEETESIFSEGDESSSSEETESTFSEETESVSPEGTAEETTELETASESLVSDTTTAQEVSASEESGAESNGTSASDVSDSAASSDSETAALETEISEPAAADPEAPDEVTPEDDFSTRITIIDVGQGSAALIESGGETVLIDTGSSRRAQVPIAILKRRGTKKINLLLNTHWDSDHCGATVGILRNFDVELMLGADYESDTRTYQSLMQEIEAQGINFHSPVPGEEYTIGSCTLRVVGPMRYDYDDENTRSISVILTDGTSSVFFGGDTTAAGEKDILASGADVDCDVYICSHHGSAYSSSKEFLEAMSPEYTIISCGKDNEYGHPAEETLKRLEECGSKVYRTDLEGDVVFEMTGEGIVFEGE